MVRKPYVPQRQRSRSNPHATTHKIHYHDAGRPEQVVMLCEPVEQYFRTSLPGQKPQVTVDPAQVTCRHCLRKMARLQREGQPA